MASRLFFKPFGLVHFSFERIFAFISFCKVHPLSTVFVLRSQREVLSSPAPTRMPVYPGVSRLVADSRKRIAD